MKFNWNWRKQKKNNDRIYLYLGVKRTKNKDKGRERTEQKINVKKSNRQIASYQDSSLTRMRMRMGMKEREKERERESEREKERKRKSDREWAKIQKCRLSWLFSLTVTTRWKRWKKKRINILIFTQLRTYVCIYWIDINGIYLRTYINTKPSKRFSNILICVTAFVT